MSIFYNGGLQRSVASVDLMPWYLSKLTEYFSDTKYSQCFESPWYTEKIEWTWVPKAHVKVPEYVNAVNTWIFLSENVENSFVQRCLLMFLDSHMHNIAQVDSKGIYKNYFVNQETDLTDDIIPNVIMDILPPSKPTKEKQKILHALSKALPARCQIRNLKEILINYVSEDDNFFRFLLKVLKNSLFGTYAHCKVRLNFKGRFILHNSFETQLQSNPFFCKWFRSGEHQVLIFFCLKEYLIHACREAAPVYEVIDNLYGWSKFDSQVQEFMNRIRSRLNIIAEREASFLVRSDWIMNIETILMNASKQHIKLFRTTQLVTYYSKIHTLIMKHFTSQNKFNVYDIVTHDVTELIWNVIQRLHNPNHIFKMMGVFNIPLSVAEGLMNKTFSQEHFQEQTDNTLKYILEFIRILDLRKKFGLYVMPQHIYEKQVEAICKKESCTAEECTDFGINYICFICNDVKMFIMKETNQSRHSNRLAKGSLRIVVDNQNDDCLKYICGRRVERHQRHGKRKWRDSGAVALRKMVKERCRNAISHRCINTPLKEINMIGHFLTYFGKQIFLCTECGNACMVTKKCFQQNNILNCGMCLQNQKKTCEKCLSVTACNNILALDRKHGRFRRGHLCASCTSIHASMQPIML